MTPPIHALAEERAERARLESTGTDSIYENIFTE